MIEDLPVATCRVHTAGSNASSRAQLLYDKWVLDVPKLLDLAAIYGPDNAPLVQQLMSQVLGRFAVCCNCICVPTISLHAEVHNTLQTN